ncbi:hypothetical protein [Streptomyces sp. NPDC048248]|uniref:hypothetical protein n=1 Tax=Streptomyces sp. NPDC048248 TaxID=3365523 RepID=UPI003720426B
MAFAFELFLVAHGRAARGFGEISSALLIAAIATTNQATPLAGLRAPQEEGGAVERAEEGGREGANATP